MTNQEIVKKLWELCNVLRDDGITYHQYVTELTYILFLKMAQETGIEKDFPKLPFEKVEEINGKKVTVIEEEEYHWNLISEKTGIDLKNLYVKILSTFGEKGKGRIKEIYHGATTIIDEPKNLEKIISRIDDLDWFSAREEGLGNLYEGLLEKNANEKKIRRRSIFYPASSY